MINQIDLPSSSQLPQKDRISTSEKITFHEVMQFGLIRGLAHAFHQLEINEYGFRDTVNNSPDTPQAVRIIVSDTNISGRDELGGDVITQTGQNAEAREVREHPEKFRFRFAVNFLAREQLDSLVDDDSLQRLGKIAQQEAIYNSHRDDQQIHLDLGLGVKMHINTGYDNNRYKILGYHYLDVPLTSQDPNVITGEKLMANAIDQWKAAQTVAEK